MKYYTSGVLFYAFLFVFWGTSLFQIQSEPDLSELYLTADDRIANPVDAISGECIIVHVKDI